MAKLRVDTHNVRTNWASGTQINIELSPKPFTITELWAIIHADITTTSATNFDDLWDRIIANLSLTSGGKTLFSFSDMRPAYHMTRFSGASTRRATIVADSQTDSQFEVAYRFHFGVAPDVVDKNGHVQINWKDLTAGIPPTQSGNLTLSGLWGTTNAPGTNVTIATTGTPPTSMDIVLVGVQAESGDPPEAWMPRAFPNWQMQSPDITTVTTPFASQINIPANDFLKAILIETHVGSNAPRSSLALSSMELFSQIDARSIYRVGGLTDSNISGRPNQELSAAFLEGMPFSSVSQTLTGQTAAPGVPSLLQSADPGLIWLPVHHFVTPGPLSQYGADLRHVETGDYQLRYGVPANSSNIMRLLYKKYQLNPDHPANAGL